MSDNYQETELSDELKRKFGIQSPAVQSSPAEAAELRPAPKAAFNGYSPPPSPGQTPASTPKPAFNGYQHTPSTYGHTPASTPMTAAAAPVAAAPPAPGPQFGPKGPRFERERSQVEDEDIDALVAKSGRGRISSRDMRKMEMDAKKRDQGRSQDLRDRVQGAIPKTKTKDSEGGDLNFDKSWQKGADGKWAANPNSAPLTPEQETSWQRTRTLGQAPTADNPLPNKARVAKYQDEEKKLGWRMMIGSDSKEEAVGKRMARLQQTDVEQGTKDWERVEASDVVTTKYDSSAKSRERSRLKTKWEPKPGREGPSGPSNELALTHKDGTKVANNPRTGEQEQHAGFVVNPATGDVQTFREDYADKKDGKQRNRHHTTPLAGGNVSGAGNLTMDMQGHVTDIGDQSGHYRPEAAYTHTGVAEMSRRGMLERPATKEDQRESGPGNISADVTLGGFAKNDPRMAKGWLEHEDDIYKGDLTLKHQQFLQTSGNERQARAKVNLNEEIGAGQGALTPSAPVGQQAAIRAEIAAKRAQEEAAGETASERKARGQEFQKETIAQRRADRKQARKAGKANAAGRKTGAQAAAQDRSAKKAATRSAGASPQRAQSESAPNYVLDPALTEPRPAGAYGGVDEDNYANLDDLVAESERAAAPAAQAPLYVDPVLEPEPPVRTPAVPQDEPDANYVETTFNPEQDEHEAYEQDDEDELPPNYVPPVT